MNVQTKPLSEITQQAIDLLFKEMGIVNTIRFLNQFTTGYGDYTQEREALFKDLTLDELLAAMKSIAGQRNAEHSTGADALDSAPLTASVRLKRYVTPRISQCSFLQGAYIWTECGSMAGNWNTRSEVPESQSCWCTARTSQTLSCRSWQSRR
jgi:hypothetical protein